MPITVSLFQYTVGGSTFAFDTGDISFGDAVTKQVQKNIGTDILEITLRKRQVTLTARGVNAAQLAAIYLERDNNVTTLVNATSTVAGTDILVGADTIYSALLLDVQSGPPITVAGVPIVEQVQMRFDSTVYV